MRTKHLIAIDDFCVNHSIDISFISSLQKTGLIQITTIEDSGFITTDQLMELEKIVQFFYELDINLEGIETITHLLQRIHTQQIEIMELRNKLRIYE
jgi:hypothetical protein